MDILDECHDEKSALLGGMSIGSLVARLDTFITEDLSLPKHFVRRSLWCACSHRHDIATASDIL